ncbi:MAG TPA: uroporphyrinogen decarboxylase [Salinimicrobium sp.]|nr:uroporphyrinogen decarboxylase [Salinimicrobium sp.]
MMEILGITLTEWTGYAASLFVLMSFLMRNITTLRYVNTVGCIFFVIYGFLLTSWPVVVTNVAIVLVNFYYLFINKKKV